MLSRFRGLALPLLALYFATLSLRAGAYMVVAIVVSSSYLPGLGQAELGLLFSVFPAAELVSVTFFGMLCDRIGRRPVLAFAHVAIAGSALGFTMTRDLSVIVPLMIGFGIGAAAQISSSLALISDLSRPNTRARLMGFYDMFALGGLAGGFLLATLLSIRFGPTDPSTDSMIFLLAALIVAVSLLITGTAVRETATKPTGLTGVALVRSVFRRPEVVRLLPVYIPVISIYGMVLAFTRRLIEQHNVLADPDTFAVLGVVGGGLIVSMVLSGYLSDRLRRRKPFIIVGLLCFGAHATMLILNADNVHALAVVWPLVLLLSLGAGAFPPAILAYLSDISRRATRGTTFGVYSLVFGTGMIIGPIMGGYALQSWGPTGFIGVIGALVATACLATLPLREYALEIPAARISGQPAPGSSAEE